MFRGKRIETNTQGIVLKEREVAIKCMFDNLPEHVIMRARREASIRIKSLNLLEMIDFVETQKGPNVYYHVVSELLNGVNLDELLEGSVDNHDGSPNPYAKKLYSQYQQNRKAFVGAVFRGLLSGISVLHDQGYIHRDIDPSNIMITSNGEVKLIDFGIAKKIDTLGTTDKQLTSDGQFAGKVGYAAPELVLGDLKHQSMTTDIYALGITLFQLVTGHLPFEGTFTEVFKRQLNDKLPSKEIGDKRLRSIIEKATEKDQSKRYQSAAEFRVAIDEWMAQNGNDEKNDNRRWIIIGIALLLIAGSVVGYILRPKPEQPEPPVWVEPDSVIYVAQGQQYIYWGEWDSLYVPNGQGKAVGDNFEYEGSFKDGLFDGYGRLTVKNELGDQQVYEGWFSNHQIDSGTYVSGSFVFQGRFKEMTYWEGIASMQDVSFRVLDGELLENDE